MNASENQPIFVSLEQAAPRVGLPYDWLKAEAKAGRIPHIKAGRRILVHLDELEKALRQRATGEGGADE